MNIWDKIDEPVMRAISGIVHSIWGNVGFSIGHKEDEKEIDLIIWDRSYRCEDKEIVVQKIFPYEILNADSSDINNIVSMIEKYLIENYS